MTTKTPPTVEDRAEAALAAHAAADAREHAALLQPWLDRVAPARAQIEPLRRQLEALKLSQEPVMLRRHNILDPRKNPKVARLKGQRMGDRVASTRAAVDEWLGVLQSGGDCLTHATAALEALATCPVQHRPSEADRVLEYVQRAKGNADHCTSPSKLDGKADVSVSANGLGNHLTSSLPLLAEASRRLRRRPGRPRTVAPQASAPLSVPPLTRPNAAAVATVWPNQPRLLGLKASAEYVGVSTWTLRAWLADGRLTRVRLPGAAGGDLDRLLIDRLDLDQIIEAGKG